MPICEVRPEVVNDGDRQVRLVVFDGFVFNPLADSNPSPDGPTSPTPLVTLVLTRRQSSGDFSLSRRFIHVPLRLMAVES